MSTIFPDMKDSLHGPVQPKHTYNGWQWDPNDIAGIYRSIPIESFGYGIIDPTRDLTKETFVTISKLEYDHLNATSTAYELLKETRAKESELAYQRHQNGKCACGCGMTFLSGKGLTTLTRSHEKDLIILNVVYGLKDMSRAVSYTNAKPVEFLPGKNANQCTFTTSCIPTKPTKPDSVSFMDTMKEIKKHETKDLNTDIFSEQQLSQPSEEFKKVLKFEYKQAKRCDCGAQKCNLPVHSSWCSTQEK